MVALTQLCLLTAAALLPSVDAFLPSVPCRHAAARSVRMAATLAGEPLAEAMPGVTATKLEVIDEAEGISKYGFEIEIAGDVTDRIYAGIEKELRKKANFPGFRKGQIPPFARGQVTSFSVEEAINESLLSALEAHGLQKLDGEDGNAQVDQKVEELVKAFKPGKPLHITATVSARATQQPVSDASTASEPEDSESTEEAQPDIAELADAAVAE